MIRTVLAAVAIVFLALSALAQEAAPARFFIERIEVRNTHRISPKLIVSESLLHEGTEYSEEDLSAASLRLSRLPFLLSVDFALEKGSDRGRYVLIINATETKPFFYLLDLRPIFSNDPYHTIDYEPGFEPEAQDLALGFRWFVGKIGRASCRERV